MDLKTYQVKSTRTAPFNANPQNEIEFQNVLMNYSAGMVGEWFELQTELSKVNLNEVVPMNLVDKVEKEIGDVLHYAVNLLTILDVEINESKTIKKVDFKKLEESLGNILEIPKKYIYHGHAIDKEKYVESIYNVISYLNASFGMNMESILQKNIDKLKLRYPEKFTTKDSIKRVDVDPLANMYNRQK